jgi:hypothetical protein
MLLHNVRLFMFSLESITDILQCIHMNDRASLPNGSRSGLPYLQGHLFVLLPIPPTNFVIE